MERYRPALLKLDFGYGLHYTNFSASINPLEATTSNISSLIVAQGTILFGFAMVDLAAISFLGLGVQSPQADWGVMVSEGKTDEEIDTELTEAATEGVKIQLVLDTLAEREDIQVSDDEFGHEIVHRAQRSGLAPQQYYDQLVRAGMAAAVYGDVRRGKALGLVLERVIIKDGAGTVLTLDDLRGGPEADAHEHDH